MRASAALLRASRADLVVEAWQPHLVSRSSRYVLARHAAMFRRRYEAVADRSSSSSAAESAAQARILHFLGRREESRLKFEEALRLDSHCAEAWAWRWSAGFARGPRSYEGVDRAVELEPARALWTALRGVGKTVEFLEGRRDGLGRSLEDLERALDLDPKSLPALIASGMAHMKADKPRRALDFFGRSLRLDARPSFLHAFSGLCRLSLGDRDGFVADCEKGVYADEGLGFFQPLLADDSAGRSAADWIEAATRYLDRHPRAYWMHVYRGDYRRAPEINDFSGGLRDLEKAVELAPDCAYAWAYLARARLSQASPAAAIEAADRSVRLNPSCGWIFIWRGELRRRLGDAKGALSDFDRGLKLDPDYDLGYAWRGGAKRLLGRPEDALPDLALAAALDPRHAWAIQEHSLALRQLGRTGEALMKLEGAHRLDPKFAWCAKPDQFAAAAAELDAEIRRHPRNPRAWAWRGEAKLKTRDYRGAKADCDRALALDPAFGWAWSWRGRAWQELGLKRRALKDFDEALRLEPGDAHARAYRGRIRHLLGDLKGALSDLRRAVDLNRKTSWIYLWAGEAARDLGLLKEAGADFDLSLGIDRRHVAAMAARAGLRLRRGDAAGAREDLEQASAAAPADGRIAYWRGVLNERDGRWGEARSDYLRAANGAGALAREELRAARRFLKRGPPSTAESIKGALAQVKRFARAGRHADAAAICGEILRVERDCEEALISRAEAYRCSGEYGKLVADLDRLVQLAPERPDSWVNRGMGRRNSWDFAGALMDAEEALRRRPDDPAAMILKSEALRNLGRFPEAIATATRALGARKILAGAYLVRGKARRQNDDVKGALADFRRASGLDPRDAKAKGWEADALRRAGRPAEASAAARAAIALQTTCAWAVALSGEIERGLGRKKAGLELVQRAFALDPNGSCAHDFLGADPPTVWRDPCYAWVYAWRGGILRKKEDWNAARRDLEHAVELDPECFWARGWLGELKLAVGDAGGALDEFARALHQYKDYRDAWTWQGRAYGEQGRWRPALASFRKALSLDAGDPWALIGCSVSLENLGRRKAAADCLGRARTIAPGLFEPQGAASC
jgi:tetratricopeptide (TPR) repeat protein